MNGACLFAVKLRLQAFGLTHHPSRITHHERHNDPVALPCSALAVLLIAPTLASSPRQDAAPENPMREFIERFDADRAALGRFFNIAVSPNRSDRFRRLYEDKRADLAKVNFDKQGPDGKLEWVLMDNHLRYNLRRVELDAKDRKEAEPYVPFLEEIVAL